MAKLTAKQLRDFIDALEPDIAAAFTASIKGIADRMAINEIATLIANNRIDDAIVAMDIDRAAFTPLSQALRKAYDEGGALGAGLFKDARHINGRKITVIFDVANPRAESEIGNLTKYITGNLTNATRENVKETILRGYQAGRGPKQIAVDISGRVNKITRNRQGGLVGLSGPQSQAADNFRARLLSNNPAEMGKALQMENRDKRFDRKIKKAISGEKELSQVDVTRMFTRYSDISLRKRAEGIAQDETGNAVMKASHEAFAQGLEKTGYTEKAVTRTWKTSRDDRVRNSHRIMNNQTVSGITNPFTLPDGSKLMYPTDSSLGASQAELRRCRCIEQTSIDFSEGLE